MDRAIPLGQRFGIGLDAILGLFPGVGDVAGGLVSAYIVYYAHRAGIPRATLLRMVANVGIDTALGAVPLVGDLFDIVFQANIRNVELYKEAMRGERRVARDRWFLVFLLLAIGLIVAVPILIAVWVIRQFWP